MSFWSALTGTESQSDQDARLAQQEQAYRDALARRQADGTISDEQAAADAGYVNSLSNDNTDAAAAQGFAEGAREGLNNVLNAPGKAVGAVGSGASQVLWGVVKNIPWWVWVGAVGYIFIRLRLYVLAARLVRRYVR